MLLRLPDRLQPCPRRCGNNTGQGAWVMSMRQGPVGNPLLHRAAWAAALARLLMTGLAVPTAPCSVELVRRCQRLLGLTDKTVFQDHGLSLQACQEDQLGTAP